MLDRLLRGIFGSARGVGAFLLLAALVVGLLAGVFVSASSPFVMPLMVGIVITALAGFFIVLFGAITGS